MSKRETQTAMRDLVESTHKASAARPGLVYGGVMAYPRARRLPCECSLLLAAVPRALLVALAALVVEPSHGRAPRRARGAPDLGALECV
jgi:hypothetical protein